MFITPHCDLSIVKCKPRRSERKARNYTGMRDNFVAAIQMCDDGSLDIVKPVVFRLFYNRSGLVAAGSILINCDPVYGYGHSGQLQGRGFYRESSILEAALEDAGITMWRSLTSARDVEDALLLTAKTVADRSGLKMHTFTIL